MGYKLLAIDGQGELKQLNFDVERNVNILLISIHLL